MGVAVCLNEADVALDRRAKILDPVALRVLVSFHRAIVESLDIFSLHGFFLRITSMFLCLGQVISNLCHLGSMVTENQAQLLAFERTC